MPNERPKFPLSESVVNDVIFGKLRHGNLHL